MCLVAQLCLFTTPWTIAHQAPLLMGFSRQEYWSGLPCPSPGDLPDPETEPMCPALQAVSLPLSQQESPDLSIFLPKRTHFGCPWWLSGKEFHLPMQETWIPSLAQQDPTCCGATKCMSHNYCSWAQNLQLLSPCAPSSEAHAPWGPCSAAGGATTMRSPRAGTRENPHTAMSTQTGQRINK